MSTTLTSTTGLRRSLAIAATAAMVFALLPFAGTAHATDGQLSARDIADACENAPETDFADEPFDNDELTQATDCIGADGWGNIVEGFEDGTYGPGENVRRDQMASMIVRKIEAVDPDLIPADPPNAFPDDDDNETHEANINIAADLGIVQGDTDGNYNDKAPVSRQQMASFVNGQIEAITGAPLASGGDDLFADDCNEAHEANVEALAWHHIVQGDADGNFNCLDLVTRADIALFVTRDLDYLVENGHATNPFSNQDFTVTPSEAETNEQSAAAVDNTGRRSYTATGLDSEQTYVIELFPAENVNGEATGRVTFESNTRVAASPGGPSIELVNGDPQSASGSGTETTQVTDVAPSTEGEITFAIDSTSTDEVVPAVYLDGEGETDGELDLDDQGAPTEPFGVGGQKNWVPAEAGQGDATGLTVETVNRDADYFVAGGATYYYDDNDVYGFQSTTITMAEFEGMLSVDDELDATPYEPEPENESTFDVTTDDIPEVQDVTAEVSDSDGDGTRDDVTVTIDGSSQPDVVYDVYRDDNDDGAIDAGDEQLVDDSDETTHTFTDEPDGTHTYLVDAYGGTSGEQDTAGPHASNAVTVPGDDTAAPQVLDNGAVVDDDNTFEGADNGDVWILYFDEAVVVADDATLAIDGQDNVENNANSTWEVADSVVTITFDGTSLGTPPASYPLTITDISGVSDGAGNDTAIGDLADTELEDDGPEIITDTCENGDTECTITFNEELGSSAADPANYTYDGGANAETLDDATLESDSRTVTLTFSNALDAGDTETITPDGVSDTDGPDASTQTDYELAS